MPNFTGVIASARLVCGVGGVELRDLAAAARSTSLSSSTWSQRRRAAARRAAPAGRRAWSWPVDVEVAAAQLAGVDPEQRRAAAEDVLDHEHPLRAAEAAERGLRGLVGLRDPAVHPRCRGSSRRCRRGTAPGPAPARRGRGSSRRRRSGWRRSASRRPSSSKPTRHVAWKPCRLPDMVRSWRAVEPQPDRAAGQGRAERRDRGEAVRLHLLAAEAAAHPQALHGDLVAGAGRGRGRRSPASRSGAGCCSARRPGRPRRPCASEACVSR